MLEVPSGRRGYSPSCCQLKFTYIVSEESEKTLLLPESAGAAQEIDLAQRAAVWDQVLKENADALVRRACAPLPNIRHSWKRFHLLGLWRDYFQEQMRYLAPYEAYRRMYPGEAKQTAITKEQAEFHKWLQLAIYDRANFELRTLQFDLLGNQEPPSVFDTPEEDEARLQRLVERKARHSPRSIRPRGELPFEHIFVEQVKVGKVHQLLKEHGYTNAEGGWITKGKDKGRLLALIRVLKERGYLLDLSYAVLARAFSEQFGIELSNSYSSRTPDASFVKEFEQLFSKVGITK